MPAHQGRQAVHISAYNVTTVNVSAYVNHRGMLTMVGTIMLALISSAASGWCAQTHYKGIYLARLFTFLHRLSFDFGSLVYGICLLIRFNYHVIVMLSCVPVC